ncbi:MAG: hypothetical protein ACM32E_15155, partial [Gemmatimonadota bacterium]
EPARPVAVSLPEPECTITATPGGTAIWNLEPQLKTSPVQSMESRSVSRVSVYDAWPGLAAVPLSHRWTRTPGPDPDTKRRSEVSSLMTRRVPWKLKSR